MDRRAIGIVGVVGAALVSVSLIARQQPPKSGQQPEKQGHQMMSMDDMMKGCREHCQATTKSIDRTMKMMDEAKASNDAPTMRAALDEAQKPLGEMKRHMRMCMNMMSMMEKMHGKGGMMKKPPERDR